MHKVLQTFEPGFEPEIERANHEQLLDILKTFKHNGLSTLEDIFLEAASHLPKYDEKIKFEEDFEKSF